MNKFSKCKQKQQRKESTKMEKKERPREQTKKATGTNSVERGKKKKKIKSERQEERWLRVIRRLLEGKKGFHFFTGDYTQQSRNSHNSAVGSP